MFISQQLVHEKCQLEIHCSVCEPELRRLEFEVNEMKLTNTYLKERLRAWALQCDRNAEADVGHNLLGPGNAAHVSQCSLQSDLNRDGEPVVSSKARSKHKVAEPQYSFTEITTPRLQSNYGAMNSSEALDLQKQVTELTEQYRSLAQKYNDMVGRLQECYNALHCSSKQTLELEQTNMELLQLKEMMKARQSCNEENTTQNLAAFYTTPPRVSTAADRWEGINQLSSPSMSTTTGKISQVHCEVYASKPHAACGQTITTMPNAKLDGVPPDYVPDDIMPTPYVIMPNGVVVPCNLLGGSYDGVLPPGFGTACETLAGVFPHKSAGPQAASELWPKNVMLAERTPKKQQPSKEWAPAAIASSPDHRSLNNRLNLTSNDFPGANNATSGQAFPDVGMSSPIACRHGAPNSINVPKIISIRANGPCDAHRSVATANATSVLSPVDHNKPGRHDRRSTPPVIKIDVQKEVKKVAVADNVECMAFPQGMYKTEMCNKWVMNKGECPYGKRCQFAHGSHELRPVLRHPSYKTMLCRMVAAGQPCPYEHRCHFRHVLNPKEALNRDLFIMNLHAA